MLNEMRASDIGMYKYNIQHNLGKSISIQSSQVQWAEGSKILTINHHHIVILNEL